MIRTITYEVLAETKSITPATKQWGGMQYEDEATEIIFDIKNLNISKALYRIDFNSAGAGYQPSTNLTCSNNKISRKIPKLVTQFGGEVQVTAVITELDANSKTTGVCYSYPVIIYFTAVEKSNHTGETVEGNISVMETSVQGMLKEVTTLKNATVSAASEAEAAQAATEAARAGMMEGGTEWVFLGGDASGSVKPDITVDNALNTGSINPVQNKVVATAIEKINNKLDSMVIDSDLNSQSSNPVQNKVVTAAIQKRIYLVASGTSDDGIWFYKKWSDGTAECWGRRTFTTFFPTKESTGFYLSETVEAVNYPFSFKTRPIEIATASSYNSTVLLRTVASRNDATKTAAYCVMRPAAEYTNVDAATVYIDYHITGEFTI